MKQHVPLISIVIPAYNEGLNVEPFYKQLSTVLGDIKDYNFEIIYINDGSKDQTLDALTQLAKKEGTIRVINFSRNFGKEAATTAGIHHAKGDAIIMIDADGQHPPELIPTFLSEWQKGNKVVVGVRASNQKEGFVKKYGSKLFYGLFSTLTGMKLTSGATDFSLIDKAVQTEFMRLTEHNRITRGLIEWIGFTKTTVGFDAKPRMAGEASYKFSKLVNLALDSFVSNSKTPLKFSIYAGLLITPIAFLAGLFMSIEQIILRDPLGLNISGTAMLATLLVFLVGMILILQGLIALYISHIHSETQNRPLFIVDDDTSVRL